MSFDSEISPEPAERTAPEPSPEPSPERSPDLTLEIERRELVEALEQRLEMPLVILGFVWLALLVIEFTRGLSRALEILGTVIWVIFIADFLLKFTLAPHKGQSLKRNWLAAVALVLPALRVFRIVRAFRLLRLARAARGLRLVRVVTSLNRGMKALGRTMGRRGFGYVVALTVIVTLVGAAGMYAFESDNPTGPRLTDYGSALWWTAMLMTTLGSEYWPQSTEGRGLCFLLALYAFAVFGYVTATLATFFIDRDAASEETEVAGQQAIDALQAEIAALREDVRSLAGTLRASQAPPLESGLSSAGLTEDASGVSFPANGAAGGAAGADS